MQLSDLLIEKADFSLSSSPEKVYSLRPPNLRDRAIFEKRFGVQGIQRSLQGQDWDIICKIVIQLMVDKSDFASRIDNDLDIDGEKFQRKVLAFEILQEKCITTKDKTAILQALAASFINSDADVKKVVQDEVKKKILNQLDGEKSLTSSDQNMDGQQSKSLDLLSKKSGGDSMPLENENMPI